MGELRERRYQWREPSEGWRKLGKVSGMDYLRDEMNGVHPPPPICVAMGFGLSELAPGRLVYAGAPGGDHGNVMGTAQGGWVASILDAAMSSVVHSLLPAGPTYSTLELKVNYVRPVRIDGGRLRAIGTSVHDGRRIGTAEGRLIDEADRLLAHGSVTCLIVQPE